MINRQLIKQRLKETVGTTPYSRFAEKADIPTSTFSRAYKGSEILNYEHLFKLREAYGVSVGWLLGMEDKHYTELPINGFASCGLAQGWFTEEKFSKTTLIPYFLAKPGDFGVYAKGESMVPVGINPGSLCIVSTSKPVEVGKAVMVRANYYRKNKNEPMATIKVLESETESSYFLKGWFPAENDLPATSFIDERPKDAVTFIAPVTNVIDTEIVSAQPESSEKTLYSKDIIGMCLDVLDDIRGTVDSEKYLEIFDYLYRKIANSEDPDLNTVADIVRMMAGIPQKSGLPSKK